MIATLVKIELRNLRINKALSDETTCFSADVWVEGRKIGVAMNRGHGSCHDYHWTDQEAGKALHEYAFQAYDGKVIGNFQPPLTITFDHLDHLIDELINKAEEEKQMRRWCKTKVCIRLKGDKQGEWRTYRGTYSPEFAAALRTKHGEALEEILNERFV